MYISMRTTKSLLASLLLGQVIAHPGCPAGPGGPAPDISKFDHASTIERDVAIIGGGASGTHAAIQLRKMGHSVVVVERESVLGGHTNTYLHPVSGQYIDYGVQIWQNIPEARDFLAHLNISTTTVQLGRSNSVRIDLRTGQTVPPPQGNVTDAMMRYTMQLLQYPYLEQGWNLPDPKYDLAPAVETLTLYAQGFKDWLQYPTIYIMKHFSLGVALGAQNGFLASVDGNNGALYEAARQELGDDALLSSTVVSMERPADRPHRILVRTPKGYQLIKAKKTIITAPPKLENLANFDLDDTERGVFGQFENTFYYTTVVRVPGLPAGIDILNRAADMPYNIPHLPGVYAMLPSRVPDIYTIYYGGGDAKTEDEVKKSIRDGVIMLREAQFNISEPEILAISNHSPFALFVSADKIAKGFYRNLYALQGQRNTYYTGAAFHTHDSAAVWRFTDNLLKTMFA
ncbi:amine oxidase, flavin-containing superfamily [Aspergillus novofumigatus IBT 16806]|uniref:Putative FAD dependent oxidoreductase n=1 Tax=Aspergillus novofumigatus (strain IBT 16806) TaxID=1392255 RepID=A0A2I1CFH4_ASPN1|nr:putative FAD dependent oxidoreductase [Aspergillus novofumigatus IBT 16806]PKX96386.1 putative FAD dependent oxidoreductase [Aspergillus novofumigatus IBT 16806]